MPGTDDDTLVAPPSELPNYVVDSLARQSPERLRAVAAWVQELADAKDNAEPNADNLGGGSEKIVNLEKRNDGPTVVVKEVPCGKENCGSCPHSPYRYHVTRDGDSVS
jgi:hypothetical protein